MQQPAAIKRSRSSLLHAALPYLVIVAVLLVWELLVRVNGIAPIYLPAPSSILRYLVAMIARRIAEISSRRHLHAHPRGISRRGGQRHIASAW